MQKFNYFEAVANLTPTYPAHSGAGHSTTTAGSSVTAAATKVFIHSISITSGVAANSLLVQNHGGTVTYMTIGAVTPACYILDTIVESGIRVVGGSAGTATAVITYTPLAN